MPLDVNTENTMEYRFYPVTSQTLKFSVKSPNDAHIALTPGPAEANPMYEIFIGGWQNSKTVIRKNRDKPDVVELDTPAILSGGEFRSFWITFYDKAIAFGINEDNTPLLAWRDPDLFNITHFGIRTSWGAAGSWKIEENWPGWQMTPIGWTVAGVSTTGSGTWVMAKGSDIPPDAMQGGFDGEQLYIGRAAYADGVIPGKIHPSHGVCYVAWGGAEHGVPEFEVLTNCAGKWITTSGDYIPPSAIQGGTSETGEPLYIGRATHNDTLTVGKVQKSHGLCYIPYGGSEISFTEYEILVEYV